MSNNLAFIYNDKFINRIPEINRFIKLYNSNYHTIYILNFSDNDLNSLFNIKSTSVKIIDAHLIYKSSLKSYNSFFNYTLSKLRNNFYSYNFWLTALSECNFARSNIINLYKYKLSIDFFASNNIDFILSLKNFKVYSLHDVYSNKNFIKHFFNNSIFKTVLFSIYSFTSSFLSDLFALILTARVNHKLYNIDTLYYNTYKQNFIHSGDEFYSRFISTKSLIPYLLSITRTNSRKLKCFKDIYTDFNLLRSSNKKYLIIESYGSFYTLFKSYFSFCNFFDHFSYIFKFFKNDNIISNKININPFVTPDAITSGFVDIPKNNYLRNCIKRLPNNIKTLILPVFKLSEGRAIISGCKVRDINVIGHEHSSGGPAHLWRTVVPLEVISKNPNDSKLYLPDKVLCEGSISNYNYLNSGTLRSQIVTIGAPRIKLPLNVTKYNEGDRPLVIIGEMHNPGLMIETILCALQSFNKQIIIRPHPSTVNFLSKYLASTISKMCNVSMDVSKLSFNDFINKHKPFLCFCGSSGAAVDILINRFPVVLIESNVYPNYNPYRFFTFPLVLHYTKDILRFIKLYNTKRFFREKYNSKCFLNTNKLISTIAESAASNFFYHAR